MPTWIILPKILARSTGLIYKMSLKNKFNKKTKLSEILSFSEAEEILSKYNFPCFFCPFFSIEISDLEIGEVARNYNIDLENLLKELNEKLSEKNT